MPTNTKIVWLAVTWFCLSMVPAYAAAGDNARDMNYSVHIDTAGDIEEVNRKINQIMVKEKIVFWEKRDVRGLGTYYKVYLGWFEAFKPARRFMRKLEKAGWSRPMAVHWFKDPPWKKKGAPDQSLPQETKPAQSPLPQERMENRFSDNGDGTFTDRKTGLMWIKNGWRIDFLSAVTWQAAVKKCADFRVGKYTDWRLPSVREWKSLVDRSVSYPALVAPSPFENIITHMPYWSRTEYVYAEKQTTGSPSARDSYTIMLYSGRFNHQKKTDLAFILPVRRPSKE